MLNTLDEKHFQLKKFIVKQKPSDTNSSFTVPISTDLDFERKY